MQALLFTDGACSGNPGPGGWAYLLRYADKQVLLSGGEAHTTNNRMELLAVIEGIKAVPVQIRSLKIITDSQYIVKAFTESWIQSWIQRGWKTSQKEPVKNQDLWQELIPLVQKFSVEWEWVKGHDGHPENEMVDLEARNAAKRFSS